jgi:uncharacterized protein
MKIHLRQIPADGRRLEGEETGDVLQIGGPHPVRALGPLRYSLDVGLSEGGLWATGTLELEVELQCVRCLEMFPYQVRIEDFAVQADLAGEETIDLTPLLREDILLALPSYPHCDWSGERVCPADLILQENAGRLEPSGEKGHDPSSSAWQTLDQLKTPSK